MFFKIIFATFALQLVLIECSNLTFINNSPYPLVKREFKIFTTWLNCKERLPMMFHYYAEEDFGNFSRSSTFKLDPAVSKDCQQLTADSYEKYHPGTDRGHMVPANHLDHDLEAIKESNYMTNIAPQTAALNRGAWLHSEEIVECWRDITPLNVFGGLIMASHTDNDHYFDSHGVRTPEWNWKVVVKQSDGDIIAWIMPNDDTAVRKNVDKYLTSLKVIEEKTGFIFTQFTKTQKEKVQTISWEIPKGCDKSRLFKLRLDNIAA